MRNTMEIEGYRAVIEFDPDIEMFRGGFVGLNGGADFYARDIAGLRREGAAVAALVGEGLLHPHLAERTPAEITHLYSHQEHAIRAIAEGRTTLVSTGTGSGKTECFLYPVGSRGSCPPTSGSCSSPQTPNSDQSSSWRRTRIRSRWSPSWSK